MTYSWNMFMACKKTYAIKYCSSFPRMGFWVGSEPSNLLRKYVTTLSSWFWLGIWWWVSEHFWRIPRQDAIVFHQSKCLIKYIILIRMQHYYTSTTQTFACKHECTYIHACKQRSALYDSNDRTSIHRNFWAAWIVDLYVHSLIEQDTVVCGPSWGFEAVTEVDAGNQCNQKVFLVQKLCFPHSYRLKDHIIAVLCGLQRVIHHLHVHFSLDPTRVVSRWILLTKLGSIRVTKLFRFKMRWNCKSNFIRLDHSMVIVNHLERWNSGFSQNLAKNMGQTTRHCQTILHFPTRWSLLICHRSPTLSDPKDAIRTNSFQVLLV
jgi:hypothetical protein